MDMASQRWEYRTLELYCKRGPLGGIIRWYWTDAPDTHYEPEERLAALIRLQAMGEDGWELVSAVPLDLEGAASGFAGMTTAIEYTFKRAV
jgi:hypothetical protein